MKILPFFQSLPDQFENNGYDYARFMKLFGWGTLGAWVLVVSTYLILDPTHSFGGAVVSILAALIISLVLFPLAVAQSSKEYSNAFALKRDEAQRREVPKKVKRKSQQKD